MFRFHFDDFCVIFWFDFLAQPSSSQLADENWEKSRHRRGQDAKREKDVIKNF